MFYIVFNRLTPNTASANRYLSFLRGFDELGIKGTAIILNPSDDYYLIEDEYQHIQVSYLWRKWTYVKCFYNHFIKHFVWRGFLTRLKEGDVVFCFGSPELVVDLVKRRDVRVFHERTESPDVLPLCTPKEQDAYLESCRYLVGLFVISSSLKNYFVAKSVEKSRIHIINMTVNVNRFIHLQKNTLIERYIAYSGTVSNNKDGVDELLKAFALVCKKIKDVKLYIIGATPSKIEQSENYKLIDSLGIKDRVILTGVVKASQMPQLLKDASVLALDRPNSLQAQNGFPTKLGEYLMTGNPVVVTKVGDIPLFLTDGETALLAEERAPEEFASKLCWALDHPKESAVIGQRGKELALRKFNYLIESKKIIDIIYG